MSSEVATPTIEPAAPQSRAGRLAARRRAAAARSRAYRARLRNRREPAKAAVDAAIVEALSYRLTVAPTTPPNPTDVMKGALLCLERQVG